MPFTAPTAASAAAPAAVADAENGAEVTSASTAAAVPAAAALLYQTRRSVGRLSSRSLKAPLHYQTTHIPFLGGSALTLQVIYPSVPGLKIVLNV